MNKNKRKNGGILNAWDIFVGFFFSCFIYLIYFLVHCSSSSSLDSKYIQISLIFNHTQLFSLQIIFQFDYKCLQKKKYTTLQ